MKKKMLAGFMAFAVLFSNNLCIANAEELPEEVLVAETLEEVPFNVMERSYDGPSYTVENDISAQAATADDVENTDPNHAQVVVNDTKVDGTISAASEMRWYAFVMNQTGTMTMRVEMGADLDADLYIYALNEETSMLELLGGSATEGKGATEAVKAVMDTGIYFFAVRGYEGTGNYNLEFYQSYVDAQYEVNDSTNTAAEVSLDENIVGVIDSPWDVDVYQFTLTKTTLIEFSISTSDGYELVYGGATNGGSDPSKIDKNANHYKFKPGIYIFGVLKSGDGYSANSTYTVNFKKIATKCPDEMPWLWVNYDGGIIYEANADFTRNYVNGNPINISYSYQDTISNSAGSQFYDISIDTSLDYKVAYDGEQYGPIGAYYVSSTKPINSVSSRPALMLTFVSPSDYFYKINCRGTGAYTANTFQDSTNNVQVLIDPETGDLIDIVFFNYFYDHNPFGVNSITYTTSYRLENIRGEKK